jgi:hypothetical protein
MTRDGGDLDIALAGQALEIQVSQPKRDAELPRQRALCNSGILLDFIEELKVALGLDIHAKKPGLSKKR